MRQKKSDLTVSFGLLQCFYWSGFATIGAFASVYLLAAGLSNSVIGVVLAVSALLAALMQPSLGSFIDKSDTIFNKQVLIASGAFVVAVSLVLWLLPINAPVFIALLFSVNYVLLQLSQPFSNAIGMEYLNAGYSMNFGIARATGSLGYAVCAYILGILTSKVGAFTVPVCGTIVFACMTATLVFLMPNLKKSDVAPVLSAEGDKAATSDKAATLDKPAASGDSAKDKTSPIDFMKKYPIFMIMLLGLVCIYYTHTVINTYAIQILQERGGNSADVGRAAAIAAGLELIPMVLFPLIRKRVSLKRLMQFSSLIFVIKIIATYLVQNVTGFLAIQVLQIGGWGILAIAIVFYVNEVIDLENASQGQAYAGVSMTMGTVSATLTCGRLLDVIGVNQTLLVGIGVGVIGFVVVMLTTSKLKTVK